MRTTCLAAAAAVALLTMPAVAADKGAPAAAIPNIIPEPLATPSCYVGALAGASVDAVKVKGTDALPASVSATGWTLGATVGCDLRIQRVVVGALARIEIPVETDGDLIKSERAWTVGARAGYLLTPSLLMYGLVGYTGTDFKLADVSLDPNGLTVGGGIEVAISKHLALTAEYTQTGLGRLSDGLTTLEPTNHMARLGLSYRFNSLMD